MDIRITTTRAQIGINNTPAKLEIKQPKADVKMNITQPKMKIHSEQSKVNIDQYQCFAECGQKNDRDLIKDNAAFSKQKALQGIARIVKQGNQSAAIGNGVDPTPSQAKENAYGMFEKDFDIGVIPKSRPKITFTGGKVDIKATPGEVNVNVKTNKPNINYTRGKLEVYLKQKNSINIEYVGRKFNQIG